MSLKYGYELNINPIAFYIIHFVCCISVQNRKENNMYMSRLLDIIDMR